MSYRIALGALLVLLIGQPTQAQSPFWEAVKAPLERMFGDSTTAPGEPKLIAYPTLAYAPETRWEFGASILYVYHAKREPTNRLSELSAFTFITLERQYGLWLDHALYTHQNNWYLLGRIRAQSFPLRYHGIGTATPPEYLAYVNMNQLWIRERALRQTWPNWYVGVSMEFQRLSQVAFVWEPDVTDRILPLGGEGTTNFGMGPSLVYDNRENVLNVRKGLYMEASGMLYRPELGSAFAFSQLYTEARFFTPVGKHMVFATQAQGVFSQGNVPFNHLALMGGESLMRGYYLGRYRDRQMVAGQVEWRWLPFPLSFTNRLGGAVFLAAGTVAPTLASFSDAPWQLAGGAGLRFLIFPDKDIYTRFDVGFTRDGPGYYLFIGEAF